MYKILKKKNLTDNITQMEIEAPFVARKVLAGQFIILRINEWGERIPLTVADYDREKGSITIIFQKIGKTTLMLGTLNEGDSILDFVGPLGMPSHLDGYKKAVVIGGGLGTAIAYPSAKALFKSGAKVDIIAGFKSKDFVILEDELNKVSQNVYITTDDGSYGKSGFVTDMLKELLKKGNEYDLAVAIGPLVMMKSVCELTKKHNIKTIVSMNPIMIDGTGMCGGCRVKVGGETKFACVDGPDFNGHLVDFDAALRRQNMFKLQESKVCDDCRLRGL